VGCSHPLRGAHLSGVHPCRRPLRGARVRRQTVQSRAPVLEVSKTSVLGGLDDDDDDDDNKPIWPTSAVL
jgi:hypothetical protein